MVDVKQIYQNEKLTCGRATRAEIIIFFIKYANSQHSRPLLSPSSLHKLPITIIAISIIVIIVLSTHYGIAICFRRKNIQVNEESIFS